MGLPTAAEALFHGPSRSNQTGKFAAETSRRFGRRESRVENPPARQAAHAGGEAHAGPGPILCAVMRRSDSVAERDFEPGIDDGHERCEVTFVPVQVKSR